MRNTVDTFAPLVTVSARSELVNSGSLSVTSHSRRYFMLNRKVDGSDISLGSVQGWIQLKIKGKDWLFCPFLLFQWGLLWQLALSPHSEDFFFFVCWLYSTSCVFLRRTCQICVVCHYLPILQTFYRSKNLKREEPWMQQADGTNLLPEVVGKWSKSVVRHWGQKECWLTTPGVFMFWWFHFIVSYWITHCSAAAVHRDKCCLRECDRAHFHCLLRLLSRVIAPAVSDWSIRAGETRLLRSNATVDVQSRHTWKELRLQNRWNESLCQTFWRVCPLWVWKLISKKHVCDVRRQRRTRRVTSSCSLRRFCVTPSCALLQGSKCWNKPWMNKVLFFNMQRNKVWVNGSSCVSNGQSVYWMVVKWLVKTKGADS